MDEHLPDCLAKYSNDPWIERQFKLKEVLDQLDRSNVSQREWAQFIQFLEKYCTGSQFNLSDRQWGQLFNLMMISRKLNHRSAKFKHILANKQQIEANAQQIRDFHSAVRSGHSIELGLDDLEKLVLSTTLSYRPGSHELELDRLLLTRAHLSEKCQPLLYSLRSALEGAQIETDPRMNDWKVRESKFSTIIQNMFEFIDSIIVLHKKLTKIEYLDQATANDNANSNLKSEVCKSIEVCRKESREVQAFYRDTIKTLHQVASRGAGKSERGLLLIKLFEKTDRIKRSEILSAIEKLRNCQMKLDEIMQDLRREFGRFYFLNDSELLKIVMIDTKLVTDSEENRRMIRKLFNNSICSFLLDDQQRHLTGVESPSGEIISLANEDYVPIQKAIRVYNLEVVRVLNELQRKLRKSLKSMLLKSHLSSDIIDWSLPVQLINLVESIKFCSKVEQVLSAPSSQSFDALMEFYDSQSRQLSRQLNSQQVSLARIKISGAVSLYVHFISLLTSMQHEKVTQVDNWFWQKQVRYYLVQCGELEVRIADARFRYKFDYLTVDQQSTSRQNRSQRSSYKQLISTKTTERCFLLASQAVGQLRMGANPFGPAGGGKTETIKALGHLLGQQVIVHNCDETNDIESLDRLIWGLAHTGLWGCFDEFNRLSSSTMSVISSTLELVQTSIRENKTTVQQQQEVEPNSSAIMYIDRDSAFFITLNPATDNGKSYKGRRRLPANLRNLFLPISMTRIQIDSIVRENLLAISLEDGTKLDDSFELSSKVQNFFHHMRRSNLGGNRCEWDLRLVMASLDRLRILICQGEKKLNQLMVEALSTEIEPRLSKGEYEEFCKLIRQEFCLSSETRDRKLDMKVEHLRLQLETRSGVLLVGGAQSGKSRTWRTLLDQDPTSTKWLALNPKSCSQLELFGGFTDATETTNLKKWQDGYFTVKVREALELLHQQPDFEQVCIVLDGPIDPDWVESLNSVLDDNRVLTLGSGERLNFTLPSNQSIKLILETDSIELASPATISRLGLIYFEPSSSDLNEMQINQLQEADKYLSHQSWNLIIICCTDLDHQAINHFFENLDPEISNYYCNRYSESHHLVDLLSFSSTKRLHIIHNIHLIEAHDRWGSKTFLELLRFTIEYDTYDDKQLTFRQSKNTRFVLTCNNLDRIDHRLVGKSSLVLHLKPSKPTLLTDKMKVRTVGDLSKDDGLFMIKNDFHSSIREIRRILVSQNQIAEENVNLFCSYSEAENSLDCLHKQVIRGDNICKRRAYILHELELRLMDKKMRASLLHLLNWLNSRRVRFIYIGEEPGILSYIRSMAKVIHLTEDTFPILPRVQESLMSITGNEDLSWIHNKIFSLFREFKDIEKMESVLDLFLKLYKNSNSNLFIRSKALENGLNHLKSFDEKVKQMRIDCEQQESRLSEKEQQIDRTSKLIASNIKDAQQQKTHINELRRELEIKRAEVLKKSNLLDAELAKVIPMLESSKAEVRQHLKPEALNEIKTLRSPPETIKDILDALFILLGAQDLAWSSIKSYLASRSLRDELTNYKFEQRISKGMILEVQNLMSRRGDSFNLDQARRASKAIVPLLKWIQSALEYGKVLIKSGPLREELQQLRTNLDKMDEATERAQVDLEKINQTIQFKEENLILLKKEKEELERKSQEINQQLLKYHKLRANLESQTIRWDRDLHKIVSLVPSDQPTTTTATAPKENILIRMCLMVASLIFHRADQDLKLLADWLKEFDLPTDQDDHENWTNFISKGQLALILGLDVTDELDSSPEESKIIQLVILRVLIRHVKSSWIPFIPLDSSNSCQDEQTIIEALCFGNILGFTTTEDIVYIRLRGDFVQTEQILTKARLQNKLVCLDVREIAPDSQQLDLASCILNPPDGCKFILLGSKLEGTFEQNLARYLIELPSILTDKQFESADQVQVSILNRLIESKEPALTADLEKKRIELEKKRKGMRISELTLLNQLVGSESSTGTSGNLDDIVKVLARLQQLNSELATDRKLLEDQKEALELKRLDNFDSSLESAKFYLNFLKPMRGFCHFSVRKYTQLLLSHENAASYRCKINNIVGHVMLSMDPQQRLEFVKRLQRDSLPHEAMDDYAEDEAQLGYDLAGTKLGKTILREVLPDCRQVTDTNRCKLIVVLHDPSKSSSPQQELDYLFGIANRTLFQTYDKVYATDDKLGLARLETALREFATSSCTNNNKPLRSSLARCLCVVNAHLSANWLNANLLDCLENRGERRRSLSIGSGDDSGCRLLILIGEGSGNSLDSGTLFDGRILDYARLRYWHDELALSLLERFDTFLSSTVPTISDKGDEQSIRKQLILFHVVCQERAKIRRQTRGPQPMGWLHDSYNFDYDLLTLALRTLDRLAGQLSGASTGSLRDQLSDYMADIIYGSRMETSEDELELGGLVRRLLRSDESASDQLKVLERLRDLSGDSHDRLLEKLTGLPDCSLVRH